MNLDSHNLVSMQVAILQLLQQLKSGGVVTMTNTDPTGVHTFTSGTVNGFSPAPDGTFDSGVLMSGDSFEWIPENVGEVPYYCTATHLDDWNYHSTRSRS